MRSWRPSSVVAAPRKARNRLGVMPSKLGQTGVVAKRACAPPAPPKHTVHRQQPLSARVPQ